MSISAPIPAEPIVEEAPPKAEKGFDLNRVMQSPAFIPGVALIAGVLTLYWPLVLSLWKMWMSDDGYYSHGVLVPLISGYIVYRWWPRLKDIKVAPAWIAAVPLAALTYLAFKAGRAEIDMILSFCLLLSLMFGIALLAGWRWMVALAAPVLYLVFAMPQFWNPLIDRYTNPLQGISTKIAYVMLKLSGFQPWMEKDTTDIYLNNFTLNVGVPCSGLKLVLALAAFGVFFAFISRLKLWANGILLISLLPLALLINGLRIALIGIVGDSWGPDAGHQFHDYSGYITLVVCFFIVFKFARWLGWKD